MINASISSLDIHLKNNVNDNGFTQVINKRAKMKSQELGNFELITANKLDCLASLTDGFEKLGVDWNALMLLRIVIC